MGRLRHFVVAARRGNDLPVQMAVAVSCASAGTMDTAPLGLGTCPVGKVAPLAYNPRYYVRSSVGF